MRKGLAAIITISLALCSCFPCAVTNADADIVMAESAFTSYNAVAVSTTGENPRTEIIRGPKGIVFAKMHITGEYTSLEYGMVFSKTDSKPEINKINCKKIKADSPANSSGQFGVLFYGAGLTEPGPYHVRAYIICKKEGAENEETIYSQTAVSFTPNPPEYQSEALNNLYTSKAEDLGYSFTGTQFIHCTFSVEDGHDMLYTSITGMPAHLVCYDLQEKKVIRELPLEGAKTVWSHGTDSKGNVYIATQSAARMFKWDPVKKELTNYGQITTPDGVLQTALYGITFDEDDNAYVGTYPSAYLVRINSKTGKYEYVSGDLCPDEKYIRAVEFHEGYIYAFGNSQNCSFSRYHVKTNTIDRLTNFEMAGDKAKMCNGIVAAGDYLVCNIAAVSGDSLMAIYKISEDRWLTEGNKVLKTPGHYASPEYEGKIYISSNGRLHAFDLATESLEITDYRSSTIRGAKFIEFDDPDLPGVTLVTVLSNGSVVYNNFGSKTYNSIPSGATPQPSEIRGLETGLKGTDTIAISEYMGPRMGILNDLTNEISYIAHSQIEGMGEAHGEFYTGGYPGSNISVIDFENSARTIVASMVSDKQDRPFKIIEAGEYVAVSTVADYGVLGGALTLIDPQTKNTQVFRNIIKDQSIISLAYRDGKIYGTTAIWGGLGIDPSQQNAKLFIFDLATKKVIKESIPDLKNISTHIMHIGDISFAPDGSLWAVSRGDVFEIDPDTLEVKREILIRNQGWNINSTKWAPYAIRWLSDNVMLTGAGEYISVIDTKTSEFKVLVNQNSTYMALSENNNLYYISPNNARLYKILIDIDSQNRR